MTILLSLLLAAPALATPPQEAAAGPLAEALGKAFTPRHRRELDHTLTLALPAQAARGEVVTFEVTGLEPGARPVLVVSRGGPGEGPCFKAIGGCLDLLPSDVDYTLDRRLPEADASGRSAWTGPVPDDARDGAYVWQAVLPRGKQPALASPPVEIEILPRVTP